MTKNKTVGDRTFRSPFWKIGVVCLLFFVGDRLLFGLLKGGMDHYYGMDEEAVVVSIGHSHSVLGIDAQRLERELGVPVAKYAFAGANTLDKYFMVRQFVRQHPSVKMVIYGVEPRLFDAKGLSSSSYTLFLPYLDDQQIGEYLLEQATWQEYWGGRLVKTSRFRDQTINIGLRGLSGRIENKKRGRVRVEDYTNYLIRATERKIRINPESVARFHETMAFLSQRGITVLLTFLPVLDRLNAIDPENQERVMKIFQEAAAGETNIFFLDYNALYQHEYQLFYDLRHLNREGNERVTSKLIEDIRQRMVPES